MTINTIVWAETSELSHEVALKFTNATPNQSNVYSSSFEGLTLNTYTRSPNTLPSSSPSGIANIVIVHLTSNELSVVLEAQKYLDSRKGIPIRVLTSEHPLLEEAQTLGCQYVNFNELTGEGRKNILKEAKKFEETLLNCFCKFDINGNGLISVDELMKVSSELGHDLQADDAKMIADSLDESKSHSGNISFQGFKKWWVMGKSDFHSFRRLCKAEMSVNKLVKLTSTHFNNYLHNLSQESKTVSQEELSQNLNFNIHSKQSFENGVGVFFEVCSGNDARDVINSKPENVKNSPFSVSLRVAFASNDDALGVASMLNDLVKPMLSSIPQLEQYMSLGLELSFRNNQKFLIVDVTISGLLLDMVQNNMSEFNFSEMNVNASGTFHVFSALKLDDLLKDSVLDIIQKALHMKFHLNTKTFNLRNALSAVIASLTDSVEQGFIPPQMQGYMIFIKLASVLRNFNFDLAFDALELKNTFIDFMVSKDTRDEETTVDTKNRLFGNECKVAKKFDELREQYSEMKNQVSQMKAMIPEELIPFARSVDLSKLEFEIMVNNQYLHSVFKSTLNFPSLNGIRDDILG